MTSTVSWKAPGRTSVIAPRTWITESRNPVRTTALDDWCPYTDNGEFATYRVRRPLNDLGASCLVVADYLERRIDLRSCRFRCPRRSNTVEVDDPTVAAQDFGTLSRAVKRQEAR